MLIVDDDKRVLDTVVEVVQALGHEVSWASNGLEALERVDTVRPDVVLLDFYMPKLSGADVLERLKLAHPALPVIILTGNIDPVTRADILRRGAAGFIPKPIVFADLGQQIEAVLAR